MKQGQLIPKHRRKRQPTADTMREQLRLAADEIIELRTVIDTTKRLMHWDRPPVPEPRSWWWRLFNRIRARVVETDPETAAKMPPMELK
jgi:hypothetical protein